MLPGSVSCERRIPRSFTVTPGALCVCPCLSLAACHRQAASPVGGQGRREKGRYSQHFSKVDLEKVFLWGVDFVGIMPFISEWTIDSWGMTCNKLTETGNVEWMVVVLIPRLPGRLISLGDELCG